MKKYYSFLNEMNFPIHETKYDQKMSNSNIIGYKDYRYDFITNKNNNYSVYFIMTKEKDNTVLSDGTILKNNIIIPTIIFSLTENGLDPETFNNLTNNYEYSEVMGKVIYIIFEFMKKYNYGVYSIGAVSNKKNIFYNYYKYHFKDWLIEYGSTINYPNNGGMAYYLIEKITI